LFSNASHLLFNFVFDVLCVHRIEARASVDNARSNAALKRIGARHEGVLHAAFARKGKFVDQNLWAIVATLHQRSQPARRNRRSTVGTAGH
jgi:RimJ/RimL family protein N-acetyltransferase